MTALVLLLLAQPINTNTNLSPVDVRQGGARLSTKRAWAVDCTGAGVTCQSDGGVWTLNVTGGGGGSTPTVSCGAGQALTWNGTTWNCVTKVGEAQVADASVSAQWAYAADASITAVSAQTAYASDASISAQWAFAADASITARQFDHAPAACPGGQYASAVAADGTLTCATPAGTGVTSVAGSTFISSSGGTAPTISLAATGSPSSSTFLRGDNTWAVPAGGGGGGSQNVASTTVSFGTGAYDATGTVTAAWASTTSVIVCAPLGEEASVDGITALVTARAAGSFTVRAQPVMGRGVGTYTIHCTGL